MGRGAPSRVLAEAMQNIKRGQLAQEESPFLVLAPRAARRFYTSIFFRDEMEPSSHFFEASALKGT